MRAEAAAPGAARDDDARHLLVVDDDPRLRRLLQRYLTGNGYRVTVAADAEEAKASLRGLTFDLVVLDVMLPGQDGVSLTRELRAGSDDPPILLLTARGEAEDRIDGLSAGADDYLPKPFDPRELLLRIATILRRTAAPVAARGAAGGVVRFGPFALDPVRRELRRGGEVVHLTTAELAMLEALAERPGVTVSREALGERGGIIGSVRAVDTQMARLRRKIEDEPRQPRHLLTVRGEGYVLRPGP
ncbi:MAG TPA: response regulator transcription factor [Geminicoccaceae bacterium]|nr:response regulator transcription factor [Geminicoccaceae bacterium]